MDRLKKLGDFLKSKFIMKPKFLEAKLKIQIGNQG